MSYAWPLRPLLSTLVDRRPFTAAGLAGLIECTPVMSRRLHSVLIVNDTLGRELEGCLRLGCIIATAAYIMILPFSQQLGDVWCAHMHQTLINVLGTALARADGGAQET